MANRQTIGELLIRLIYEDGDAQERLQQTKKNLDETKDSAKSFGETIRKDLTGEFERFFRVMFPLASVTASIMAMTRAQNQLTEAGRKSRELGLRGPEYAAWGVAAERIGHDAQSLQQTMESLQDGMQEAFLTGRSTVAGVLSYLGVQLMDVNGKTRTVTDVMKDLSKVFADMPIAKARIYGQMMGIPPDAIAAMQKASELIPAIEEELKNGISQEDIDAAMELQKAWKNLEVSTTNLGRELLTNLAPALELIVNGFAKLVQWISENPMAMWAVTLFSVAQGLRVIVQLGRLLGITLLPTLGKLASGFKAIGAVAAMFARGFVSSWRWIMGVIGVNPILGSILAVFSALKSFTDWLSGEKDTVAGEFFSILGISADDAAHAIRRVGEAIQWILTPFARIVQMVLEVFGVDTINRENPNKGYKEVQPGEEYSNFRAIREGYLGVKEVTQPVSRPQNIYNRNIGARTLNSTITNEVTINAPGGNPTQVREAVQSGISGGMAGFDSFAANFETGVDK